MQLKSDKTDGLEPVLEVEREIEIKMDMEIQNGRNIEREERRTDGQTER